MATIPTSDMTDHLWSGDDEGHNCFTCQERDDSLHLCWPQSHPCGLCEKVPCAWPDVFCAPCRADANDRSDEVTDPVEHVLNKHGRMEPLCTSDYTICRCTAAFPGGPAYHRRHLAEKVYEALGITGPTPWIIGPESESRERFDDNDRIIPSKRSEV